MASDACVFADRHAAGVQLARHIKRHSLRGELLVLALPRGGLPVAEPVAAALHAPLDVLIVRKIAMPGNPEFAIGAVASGGILVLDPSIAADSADLPDAVRSIVQRERAEIERRERLYREGRAPPDLRGRTVLLVDDGLATGATMLAAVRAARAGGASDVLVAAPVASSDALDLVGREATAVFVPQQPASFRAVGQFYGSFDQVSDKDVRRILRRHLPAHAS
jgi:predicted phosphoribosyltransferase